jgi:glycosyltransferase involved in cell wall biosynthesis
MQPLISVLIPTHNRPQMLAEALASVRLQTFSDFEIIVVSNGENAETRSLTRSFARAHEARYFELDQGNVSIARNFGLEQAHGDWIAFLDDDDLWLPHKLERQISEAARTGADLIACNHFEVYPDGGVIVTSVPRLPDGWTYTKALSNYHLGIQPSSTMVRKAAIKAVGGFDPRLRWSEDMDVWRRISWRHSIHQMDEILVELRSYRHGHLTSMHPQNERQRYIHELKHFAKMWSDTPRDLRSELPSAATFVRKRHLRALAPDWLLGFLHRLQLVRFRLGIRTRFKELCHRLQLRTRSAKSNSREDGSGGQEPRQAG